MNKKPRVKRAILIVGSYILSFTIYLLMEDSRLFCPNKITFMTVFCIDYLWKATVWSIFYFILIVLLYFVERKYLNSWKSLALMLFVPKMWSIYMHNSIINMSKNADGIGNYVYNIQEVWLVLLINLLLLFGFLFWVKRRKML